MNIADLNMDAGMGLIMQNGNVIPFNEKYFALRTRENRIYTDEELLQLPLISKNHMHAKEWRVRENSCRRLVNYLKRKGPVSIVEIGCGNGWLSHQLSKIPNSAIKGIDINERELKQAGLVFREQGNLSFINGDIYHLKAYGSSFDIIVFAASIQYFDSFSKIITNALEHLREGGELHIIDSPFYRVNDIREARKRTNDYFSAIGFPEMTGHYFHHSIEDCKNFNYSILYDPNSLLNKFSTIRNPFHWIRIRKNK
ncbi:MAG: class I SAM-dependent methyltransferase [Chitinophagaceae bacterium]|nr:class I SAM-dependent methyltransferase [Chitinophagaceae bacterium]